MSDADVIVIGGGIGCLCSAVLLGAQGLRVLLLESADELGGKAGRVVVDGVEMDTGPSVLTLPGVFDDVFEAVGLHFAEEVQLLRPEPAFCYSYPDGVELSVHHELDQTLHSIDEALGSEARLEMERYLTLSRKIWEAADPHFVRAPAPSWSRLVLSGWSAWTAVTRIDALRTMLRAIESTVRSRHLRHLLMRYATYNGSDVRRAPGTLGCIAHVELALGGYGVRGGMYELVLALERAARAAGVEVRTGEEVTRIFAAKGRVEGVDTTGGHSLHTERVVSGADAVRLWSDFVDGPTPRAPRPEMSMSAHTALVKASRRGARAAHTVLFPENYTAEFEDIFDHRREPLNPTIYLCAQEKCHDRKGWAEHEPLFAMTNAPAVSEEFSGKSSNQHQKKLLERLLERGATQGSDEIIWWRSPEDLAERFIGSAGSLYGWASNDKASAFRRPKNRFPAIRGLYCATGSAHPGGGVPMVAQSGKLAARALLEDWPLSSR